MKKIVLGAVIVSLACAARAAFVPKESHEFIFDLATDIHGNEGYSTVPALGGVGYFFLDNIEGGLYLSMRKTKWESYWGVDTAWGFGVFGEADFFTDSLVIPFLSARAGLLDGNEESDTAFNLAAGGGARFYLTERFCLTLQAEVEWASKEVFNFDRISDTEGSGDKLTAGLRGGIRYIF